MLQITPKAAVELKEYLKAQKEGALVRLRMAGYGWGGPNFGLALDESTNEGDQVWEDQGIKVVVEERLLPFLKGAVIDYRKNIFGQGQFQVLTGSSC